MNRPKKYLTEYRKTLLNRLNVPVNFLAYLENILANDVETSKNTFHKIMVHSWCETAESLFKTLTDYTGGPPFLPIKYVYGVGISSFYTCDLKLVLKALKHDFLFPYRSNMFSFDIMFNDKNCEELFMVSLNLDDIVGGMVSRRFTQECELNLSDFCCDTEFSEKEIIFYSISLLSQFNDLMVRMGRDTKILNLSNNNLSDIPFDILSFFVKGDLKGLNLSGNDLQSVEGLVQVRSHIERLWLEGNPLCENKTQQMYLKLITAKFPNVKVLDGVHINRHGIKYPFWKNYLPDATYKMTHMITERFITLYFSHYDTMPRHKLDQFYHENAYFTLNTSFTEQESKLAPYYGAHTSKVNRKFKRQMGGTGYFRKANIMTVLVNLPPTMHDPTTFTVDVLAHDKKHIVIVVDGIYKELNRQPELFQFRRTFVLVPMNLMQSQAFLIKHETFSISFASKEMTDISFKVPIKNLNTLAPVDPTSSQRNSLIKAFQHVTKLNKSEIKSRLMINKWDLKTALQRFCDEVRLNRTSADRFITNDDNSDISTDDNLD